jgi:hypothetical protein
VNPPAPPVSPEASAAPTLRPGSDLGGGPRAAILAATKAGLGAFAIVALAAQAVPALIDVFGAGLALATALKLGWFYELAFHRVGIDIIATGGTTARVSVAFLTGTGLALWLLFRAGRATAVRAGPLLRDRAIAVTIVGVAYALPIAVITAFVRLRLDTGVAFLPRAVRLQGVVWQAFAFPALLGIVAAAAGATIASIRRGSRTQAWLIGGWRMALGALGLSVIGVLMLAAVRPQGLATYTRAVSADGSRVALLLLGHHALLLPDQSFLVLAPSMGGCTSLRGPSGTLPLICPGTLPVLDTPTLLDDLARVQDRGSARAPSPSRPMSAGYWTFLLVPLLSTLAGGRWIASRADDMSARLLRAAGAGVVFAVLVGIGTWMANVEVVVGSANAPTASSFTLGARPSSVFALALVWGVVGGSVGALTFGRRQDEGTPVPVEPDDPAPPNPTSV